MWKRFFGRKPEPDPTGEMAEYFKTPEGRAELEAYFSTEKGQEEYSRAMNRTIAARQPSLKEAFPIDVATYHSLMMRPIHVKSGLPLWKDAIRLAWKSDAFLALLLYRVRVHLSAEEVPLVPAVLHRLCMMLAQLDIGEKVVMHPGVYFPHGQVIIDGVVEIGPGTVIAPWVTLGRHGADLHGPTIAGGVFIGTGAKVLGPIKLGAFAKIGANAVVMSSVPAHATAVGMPAKIVRDPQKDIRAAEEAQVVAAANGKGAA